MTFSCRDRPGVSSMMKNNKFLLNCDRFVGMGRNRGTRWNTTGKISDSDRNLIKLGLTFGWSPSTGGIKIGLTLKIEFSTHREVMDKPLWGLAKLVTKFKFLFKKWPFVTLSVAFYVNFSKNHWFWWFWWSRQGRDGYSESDVFKRSRVMNRCTGMPRTWSGVL